MTLPNKDNYDKLIEMHSRVKTLFDSYYAAKKIEDEIVAEDQISGHATLYKQEQAQAMHALDQAIVDLVTNMPVLEEEPQFGVDTDPNSPPLEWMELPKGAAVHIVTLGSGGSGNLPPEHACPTHCGSSGHIGNPVWSKIESFAGIRPGGEGHFGGRGGVSTTPPPGLIATVGGGNEVFGFPGHHSTSDYSVSGHSNVGITRASANKTPGYHIHTTPPVVSDRIRSKSWMRLMLDKMSKMRKHISN